MWAGKPDRGGSRDGQVVKLSGPSLLFPLHAAAWNGAKNPLQQTSDPELGFEKVGFSVLESCLHFRMRPFPTCSILWHTEEKGSQATGLFFAALGEPLAHSLPITSSAHPPTLAVELALEGNEATGGGGREEEIDRLESSKKKLQRELEEQMDVNDAAGPSSTPQEEGLEVGQCVDAPRGCDSPGV